MTDASGREQVIISGGALGGPPFDDRELKEFQAKVRGMVEDAAGQVTGEEVGVEEVDETTPKENSDDARRRVNEQWGPRWSDMQGDYL